MPLVPLLSPAYPAYSSLPTGEEQGERLPLSLPQKRNMGDIRLEADVTHGVLAMRARGRRLDIETTDRLRQQPTDYPFYARLFSLLSIFIP